MLGGVAKERRGQHYAFILGALAIIGGIVLIAYDKDVQGLVAIITTLVTLAGVFIYGRSQQTKEREAKQRANP